MRGRGGRGGEREIGMGSTVGVEKVVRVYTLHACTTEAATLDCCLHPVTAPAEEKGKCFLVH